jgi:peptide/nickel transport system permease protein
MVRTLLRDRAAVAGVAVLLVVVVGAVGASWISPYDPVAVDFNHRFATPSIQHPLGTDNLGRDTLSRLLHGARLTIGLSVVATAGITLLGLTLGLVAGIYGRAADTVIMRVVDVMLSLPTLILALVVVGILGQGLRNLIISVILVQWASYARVVRGIALTVRERPFVEAARALGARRSRLLLKHVLPNLIGPMVVLSTLDMGRTLLAVSGLSFLGFGAKPPTPEWGAMLAESRRFIDRAPQLLALPGMAITIMVLAFNLAGDGLRDFLDPTLRRQVRGRAQE